MKNYLLVALLTLTTVSNAQEFTESNLPIVIIEAAETILDEPRIYATMKIISRPDGSKNYITDQNTPEFLNYNGKISIEIRGSSSQSLSKKPYGLTTLLSDNANNNVSILGLPKENDWILNSFAFDRSYMRDHLSYELSRNIGNYASRGKYCELVLNGKYQGLYYFQEKIKIDGDRIDIQKMTPDDNDALTITGGYVIKCDKTTGGDPVAWEMGRESYQQKSQTYIFDNPKPSEISTKQGDYIKNLFFALSNLTKNNKESISSGYPSIIDIPSFVDFILLNELTSNVDGYEYSTYFHKDRNGKLRAGPIWDFNLTFGNDLYYFNRSLTNVWQLSNGDNEGSPFWKELFNSPTFKCYLVKRWNELSQPNQPLNYTMIEKKIDELIPSISEAVIRDQNSSRFNHTLEIDNLKNWLKKRIAWMNEQLIESPNCLFPTQPNLVISKINYNPLGNTIQKSDDLEFIEITNNSSTTVNLTGFYFRELGFAYSFPNDAKLASNEKLILASDAAVFTSYYGFSPYGQFERGLSNKSQKLILADAFGNPIDVVTYFDASPWPTDADGKGYLLELINLNSDNNIGSNWKATDHSKSLSTDYFDSYLEAAIKVYPNPATSLFYISNTDLSIKNYQLFDTLGRIIVSNTTAQQNEILVNTENISPNAYILKLNLNNGKSIHKKIVVKR